MKDIIDKQVEYVRTKFPLATCEEVGNGTHVVTIPDFPLPTKGPEYARYNKDKTTVRFLLPVGYPMASPAYFWTDGDLTLRSGGTPSWTDRRISPGIPEGMMWWSIHLNGWSPNRDQIHTYVMAIKNRLWEVR